LRAVESAVANGSRENASKIELVPQTLPNPLAQLASQAAAQPHGIMHAPVPLRIWHLASLDAPTVAVVWALAFARAAGDRLPLWMPILLGLVAWAVYIADRLLDARSALRSGRLHQLADRHYFHHRHRRLLAPVAAAAAVAATAIVFILMPIAARERNSVLAVAALAYFTRVHSAPQAPRARLSAVFPGATKELLVGLLFTAACVLPALSRASGPARGPLLAAASAFVLLAWLNCHAIDRWEKPSILSRSTVVLPAGALALCALAAGVALVSAAPRVAALLACAAVSALLLAGLHRLRQRLTPLALRAAADLVLLTPLVLLLK
jgi:hypothetical protein